MWAVARIGMNVGKLSRHVGGGLMSSCAREVSAADVVLNNQPIHLLSY